jgi:hypothetical protein
MSKELVATAIAAKSLAPIADKVHATVQSTGALQRSRPSEGLPPELITRIFETAPGGVVSVPTANGDGIVVAHITGVAHPPRQLTDFNYQRFAANVDGQVQSDLDLALAMAARNRLGVTINQQQVDRVTGRGGP